MPTPNDITLMANLGNNVFFPLLKYGTYPHQAAEGLIITCFLQAGNKVIDVGANIGHVTAVCSSCVGPEGAIHSFEPSTVTFDYIKQLSKQLPQIKAWQLAVSNKSGSVFFLDETMSDRSHISNEDCPDSYKVKSVTLDAWANKNHINQIDFIKVDAEGFDYEVIQGASNLIKTYNPIIEFEAFSLDTVRQIENLLLEQCPTTIYTTYRVHNSYPISAISKSVMTNNYFAIPHSRKSVFPQFLFNHSHLIKIIADKAL